MKRLPEDRTSTPPGEILLEEFLKPLGLTARELAEEIGMPPAETGRVVRGERPVDGEVAAKLSRRFGTSEAFWLGLQDAHDRTKVRSVVETKLEAGEITHRLRGSIRRKDGGPSADEEEYRRYLERRYD